MLAKSSFKGEVHNAIKEKMKEMYDINVKYEVIPDAQFTNLSQVRLSTGEVLSGVMAVGYNKTVFKKLGIEIPKTYDDFRKALDTVKNSGKDITPISCL